MADDLQENTCKQDLPGLICASVQALLTRHVTAEQQQVDALLQSQKHLTSNVRTLINSLDTILQLSTPKYNTSQTDLVAGMASRAKVLAHKLEVVSDRLQRIEAHVCALEAAAGAATGAAASPDPRSHTTQLHQQQLSAAGVSDCGEATAGSTSGHRSSK